MMHVVFSLALCALAAPPQPQLAPGTQLSFRGTLEARREDAANTRKSFELSLWVTRASETDADVFWQLEERGRGEFSWSEHFGRVTIDAQGHLAGEGPALLYDRGEARSVVAVLVPLFFAPQPLTAGLDFREGKIEFHVDKAATLGNKPAWQVQTRDAFGPKRLLLVDQTSPAILTMIEKLTLGQGEEYQLRLEWVGTEKIEGEHLAALGKTAERLLALRGKLNQPARSQENQWKPEQVAVLREQLPPLAALAVATPLAGLLTTATRDLEQQAGRNDAIAELTAKFTGQSVADFSLRGLDDAMLSLAGLKDHVTVLHFWDYRDEPLKEPYGQVGYLDFLYHRRQSGGVQVYGVAVDGRLADEKTRAAAERGVRKLKQFMNLGYSVLLDSGSLIKQFGDPRLLGASLPLFVVVGRDGKILHYHVGAYDVHQDQGLKDLDQAVQKALEGK